MENVEKNDILPFLHEKLFCKDGLASIQFVADGKDMFAVKVPIKDFGDGETVELVMGHSLGKFPFQPDSFGLWFPKEKMFDPWSSVLRSTGVAIHGDDWIVNHSLAIKDGKALIHKAVMEYIKESFPTMESIESAYHSRIGKESIGKGPRKEIRRQVLQKMLGKKRMRPEHHPEDRVSGSLGDGIFVSCSVIGASVVLSDLRECITERSPQFDNIIYTLWREYAIENAKMGIGTNPAPKEKNVLRIHAIVNDPKYADAKGFSALIRKKDACEFRAFVEMKGFRRLWSEIQNCYIYPDVGPEVDEESEIFDSVKPEEIVELSLDDKVLFRAE